MSVKFIAAAVAAIVVSAAGSASAQAQTYGGYQNGYSSGGGYGGYQQGYATGSNQTGYGYGDGYGARQDGYYSSGSTRGYGSYSSESRHYDSGWRRAEHPYPAPGYGGGYYGGSYDYSHGAPYAQGYGHYSSGQGCSDRYRYTCGTRHNQDRGGRYGYSSGYRDWSGYQDDRPASRAVRNARDYYGGERRDCRCEDVYLYDR